MVGCPLDVDVDVDGGGDVAVDVDVDQLAVPSNEGKVGLPYFVVMRGVGVYHQDVREHSAGQGTRQFGQETAGVVRSQRMMVHSLLLLSHVPTQTLYLVHHPDPFYHEFHLEPWVQTLETGDLVCRVSLVFGLVLVERK